MKVAELRKQIHHYINFADEQFLNMVYALVKDNTKNSDMVVGYHPDGTPITKLEFVNDIKEAEEQIERGEYLTIEKLEKEAENW
ncbi:MAG: hypothetical protein B6D61_01850 [Bacteroidetes bacterium 4484_249]|nr:MAG: hypothetical protein B6D61_01850 [Bacteroidetes bacterium 4484_249]